MSEYNLEVNRGVYRMKRISKVLLIFVLMLVMGFPVAAASTSKEAEENIENLESEKEALQAELKDLESNKASTEENIGQLDALLKEVQGDIADKEAELVLVQADIKETQDKLEEARAKESQQYEILKKRIKVMYEQGETGYYEVLLNAEDISSLLNNSEYISKISDYDSNLLQELQEIRLRIEGLETQLKNQLAEIEALKAGLEVKQAETEMLLEAKASELIVINQEIEEAEATYNEKEKEIEQEKVLMNQLQIAESNIGNVVYTGTSSTGYIWPVAGYSYISSSYGARICPFHGPEYHYGIDIPAAGGTSVLATANGVVSAQAFDSGLGNYIIIDHGNGVQSYYLHNSTVSVSIGQTVTQGQVIAGVGTTGSSTGNHLDFRVRVNGSYVNPLAYVSP